MVSSRGYQTGCLPVAEKHGVKLLVLSETSSPQVDKLINQVIPMINIREIKFACVGTPSLYTLEDKAGKLAYLANQTKIYIGNTVDTVHSVINRRLSKIHNQTTLSGKEFIPFDVEATIHPPDVDPFKAISMEFTAEYVNGFVANGPTLDNHVLQSLSTTIELQNVDGTLAHKVKLADIDFGFNTNLKVGKFYTNPTLKFNYYCKAIDGDMINMILLESYQHGKLIQTDFLAEKKHCKGYVEISETKEISRLKKMLAEIL